MAIKMLSFEHLAACHRHLNKLTVQQSTTVFRHKGYDDPLNTQQI
jgi:hypothetical protein